MRRSQSGIVRIVGSTTWQGAPGVDRANDADAVAGPDAATLDPDRPRDRPRGQLNESEALAPVVEGAPVGIRTLRSMQQRVSESPRSPTHGGRLLQVA
jgi:hypothetical protein